MTYRKTIVNLYVIYLLRLQFSRSFITLDNRLLNDKIKLVKISLRQKDLLEKIVEEYIYSAQPVSSQLLEKKYRFKVCPATIRNEMQALTRAGYLLQPHISAGRVPTDKGYRFFVDELLAEGFFEKALDFKIEDWFEKEIKDTIKFVQSLTKSLAVFSSDLALSYLPNEKILWREGWEGIFEKPEFKQREFASDFSKLLKNFEKSIEELNVNSGIKIYIGKENPFPKAQNFSIIISKCRFPKRKKGILAILGPKRMNYNKNISLLNSLAKLLEDL